MDKLRALQYFVSSAQEGSFSRAASRLGVSLPAVAKLVASLERELGTALFDRSVHGLTLTADGESYLETCRPLLEELAAADEMMRDAATRPRGTLVVGAHSHLAQHCLLPALYNFHARCPDIRIDLHVINQLTDPDGGAVDLFVILGWPQQADLVLRRIAQTRLLTCAAPSYWAAHGVPQRPKDLERHVCFPFRIPSGTVLDLWEYERGGEREAVAVGGWLLSNLRDVTVDAALAGEGVVRVADFTVRTHLRSGRLVPVLLDWEMKAAPPVNLLYRPNHRRNPRVRLFIDLVTELFGQLEAEREHGTRPRSFAERPQWNLRRYGRVSAAVRERRRETRP